MTSSAKLVTSSCPDCGDTVVRQRFGSHPRAERIRHWAYYAAGLGFALPWLLFILPIPVDEMLNDGVGKYVFLIAMTPTAILAGISLLYTKVWRINCGGCRTTFVRTNADEDWKAV